MAGHPLPWGARGSLAGTSPFRTGWGRLPPSSLSLADWLVPVCHGWTEVEFIGDGIILAKKKATV